MMLPGDCLTNLIMVAYHRPNDLAECVGSVLANTDGPFRLHILDNSCGAIDGLLDGLADPRVTVLKNPTNLGKGRAFMRHYWDIVRGSGSDFFVSIDSDLLVPPGWLGSMLRAAYGLERPGLLAPVFVTETGEGFGPQRARGRLVMHRESQGSGFVGPSLFRNRYTAGPLFLVYRPFFEKVGGYVQTQLYGNDDGELCKAAHREGRFIGITTDVEVVHLEGDVTPGYRAWKARNVRMDSDRTGYFDQNGSHGSSD